MESPTRIFSRLAFQRRRTRIERHAERIAALCDDLGLLQEEAAQHHDALIGGREMLVGMKRDRTLAGLGLVIVREALMLLLAHIGPFHPAGAGEAARPARRLPQRRVRIVMRVVDRQHPAHRFACARCATAPCRGTSADIRQHALDDAQEVLPSSAGRAITVLMPCSVDSQLIFGMRLIIRRTACRCRLCRIGT